MSGPRVSVLLPVRDEEPFLAECLESLSAQTLPDFRGDALGVSGPEGRARVRKLAAGLGLVEGTDFVAIA